MTQRKSRSKQYNARRVLAEYNLPLTFLCAELVPSEDQEEDQITFVADGVARFRSALHYCQNLKPIITKIETVNP